MSLLNKKRIFIVLIVFALVFIGAGFLFQNKIKISIQTDENINSAIAKTREKKVVFEKNSEEYFKQGHEQLKNRKLDEAIKSFNKAAKISPNTPVAHYWLGMAYFYNKENEKAIAKFKKVLELEPDNYRAYGMIGKILSFDKTKLDEAIKYLEKALSINPDYAEAHFDLGRIHALRGDMNRALGEFGIIFGTEPKYAIYHFELGRIFESMNATDRAKREYERALQLNPNFSRAKESLEKLK
jgi:tetratricopeptide (TPR) repeat protein